MGATLFPFNIYTVMRDRDYAILSTQQRLFGEVTLAAASLKRWEQSIQDVLEVVAFTPSVRQLRPEESQMIFDRVERVFPTRGFRLWNKEGLLVASTEVMRPASATHVLQRSYFQESLLGKPSWGIYDDCLTGSACYVKSVPVYATSVNRLSTAMDRPIGILTNVIRLRDTGRDSGLDAEGKRLSVITENFRNSPVS
ncbi:MAG: hypothetical protein ACKO1Y_10420, partial [Actinomycetota bacterium]